VRTLRMALTEETVRRVPSRESGEQKISPCAPAARFFG
jgi:hypothetical protein